MTKKEKTYRLPELGLEVVLGKYAAQAAGAAWLRQEGTVVLATVASSATESFPGFLPLSVDYRENFSAAGKIPGGYFKREGRFSDREILNARLVDRAIRPLFPANYFDQVQVLATVYSVDKEHVPHVLALLASSIALTMSRIPFLEPVGVAEVIRLNGTWIVNPTYSQIQASDTKILVAGTAHGINMVEGTTGEISEHELVNALFMAHEIIKKQVAWQHEIVADYGVTPSEHPDIFGWDVWKRRMQEALTQEAVTPLFVADKIERTALRKVLQASVLARYASEITESGVDESFVTYVFDKVLSDVMSDLIITLGRRVDGRPYEKVRSISTEVGLLPCAHGSALFNRGHTQALVSVTLGGGQDAARIDRLMGETVEKTFMLHYNFPPFSVGEVKPLRGPGRREIGHGYLAAAAIEQMLPIAEQFPYTIRVVADMLESDGSTSMATVCGSTMALMDAGVPVKNMVSGVAMGLLQRPNGGFQVLTDIAGIEDEFGLMDFKVAGTDRGITAIQMDIKYKGGLERAVFEQALAAARIGRIYILEEMVKVMSTPRAQLSSLVPQVVSFKIPVDKIGAIIGTGGKTIREIIEKTATSIDIEDDGLVKIYGQPGEKLDTAIRMVKTLSGLIEKGTRYQGIVKRIAEFGIFVEIAPGQDGLVHVSTIPRAEQQQVMQKIKPGDVVTVEVMDYDSTTGRIRLMIVG